MKIRLAIFAFFICFASQAQMKQGKFVFGPKVGLQTAKLAIVGENPEATDSKLALYYQGGVFTRFNMGKVSLQPEFIYTQKGGNIETPNEKHTYRYLATPVLLGYKVAKGVNLEVGPEFSWALNQGWKKEGVTQFGPDVKNETSLVVGTRIDLLDMFSMFSVNIRYTHGLTNTTMREYTSTAEVVTPLDFRNRTVQVSVTYNFSEYYKWWKKYGQKQKKD